MSDSLEYYKAMYDSLRAVSQDTIIIPMPYPVEVEVPAQLSWWQKTRMRMGEIALVIMLAAVAYIAYRIYRKFSKL